MNVLYPIALFFFLISHSIFSQIAFYDNVFLAEEGTLGIFTSEARFIAGGIRTDDARPGITYFAPNTQWTGATHTAHVEGYVWITDHSDFDFPVGHEEIFQPMAVHNSPNSSIAGRFVHLTPPVAPIESGIGKIAQNYFWEVIGDVPAQLSFGWTSLSNLSELTDDIENLILVGHNGNQWKIIPSQLNTNFFGDAAASTLNAGAITALDKVDLNTYSRFTLGSVVKDAPSSFVCDLGFSFQNVFDFGVQYTNSQSLGGNAFLKLSESLQFGYAYNSPINTQLRASALATHEILLRVTLNN